MRLSYQTVVITGASSGLGKDLALAAAKKGANIVLMARREAELKNLKAKIQEDFPVKCHYFVVDVTDENAVYDAFQQIEEQFDGIDVLINNAGFGIFQTVEQMSLQEMKQMFDVNVFGVMTCSKLALTSMKLKGKGHIINIASLAGKIATSKAAAYAGSKHAVLGFSNALRQEVEKDGIYITNVNPGPMDTPFFDIADESGSYAKSVRKMMLDPEKVASKVISLIGNNIHEVDLPSWMGFGAKIYSLFPRASYYFMMKFGNKK
ncbi:SDR family oxidoreductase [Bacillus sp. AFS041924]|uniref:SDR family NAD(P)-dependent oxidoreductase n=1 Tax=Bacillus sp. AFS041924 TaxID=2033503 RepID=UPI000BFC05A4|nr:SDR family oxidoreductase [Bacillus sp. AFS041924]PGS48611.1 oxidoreductase [Bacillus sp. AFS041924]